MSATRGWRCVSPPVRRWELSIHPHATRATVALDGNRVVVGSDVLTIATSCPSGERYAGVLPAITNELPVVPVQVSTVAWALVSHTAPAADGGPAIPQLDPPTVDLRIAGPGSPTVNSCGPQHNHPPLFGRHHRTFEPT